MLLINPASSGVCTVHPNSPAKPMQRSMYSIISAVVSLAVDPATVTDWSPIQLTRWQKHLLADFVHLRSSGKKLNPVYSFMIQERWPDSEGPPMWTNENRARYDRSHLRYPSDLTDDEWQLVEPLIPPGRRGEQTHTDHASGCEWPHVFSPPVVDGEPSRRPVGELTLSVVRLWSWGGTLELIHHELYVKCRERLAGKPVPLPPRSIVRALMALKKGGFD